MSINMGHGNRRPSGHSPYQKPLDKDSIVFRRESPSTSQIISMLIQLLIIVGIIVTAILMA